MKISYLIFFWGFGMFQMNWKIWCGYIEVLGITNLVIYFLGVGGSSAGISIQLTNIENKIMIRI